MDDQLLIILESDVFRMVQYLRYVELGSRYDCLTEGFGMIGHQTRVLSGWMHQGAWDA